MADDPIDEVITKLSFGIRGDSLKPQEITELLGIEPSHAFAKGDVYESKQGKYTRPWGVWQLRTEDMVQSEEFEDHAVYLLERLEPKRAIIESLLKKPDLYVDVGIWWEADLAHFGFTLSSTTVRRLAELSKEINISFIGKASPCEER